MDQVTTQTTDTVNAVPTGTSPSQSALPPTAATPQAAAAPSASIGASAAATGTAPPPTWFDSFKNPENKGFVQTKGFDGPEMAIESQRNLEKLMGIPKERLLALPEDMSKPEAQKELSKVFERLGKPESADKYDFGELPKDAPASQKEFTDWAKNAFHKANLTASQAKEVVDAWNNKVQETSKSQIELEQKEAERSFNDLKANWGNVYEQNLTIAKSGAKEFGLTADQIDGIQKSIGYEKTMKLFHNIGSKLGEAQFTNGQSKGFGAMSPDSARLELQSRMSDKAFMQKYTSGDTEAKNIMNRLHADAFPGQVSISG